LGRLTLITDANPYYMPGWRVAPLCGRAATTPLFVWEVSHLRQ